MCSIIGYKGEHPASPIIVKSLKRMEYRGYDSVGIATVDGSNGISLRKGTGRVTEVAESLGLERLQGNIGIGHTRWATHGGVTEDNAHPHVSCGNEVAVVHNGIIENYQELKDVLEPRGHLFRSQTDSEVIAHLIEEFRGKGAKEAILRTCKMLRGTYAFVALFDDGTVAGARYDEPLILGVSQHGYFLTSDVLGFSEHTDRAVFLVNGDVIVMDEGCEVYDFEGASVKRTETKVSWEFATADKGIYAHHTLKEIYEQRFTISKAMRYNSTKMPLFSRLVAEAQNVYVTGCGTSYHASLLAKHLFARFAAKSVEPIMSSELPYASLQIDKGTLVVAISQSGETADVLRSAKAVSASGGKVVSIVNIATSSLARMSACFLETGCGPEVGVAATKTFTGQLAVLYSVADALSSDGIGLDGGEMVAAAVDRILMSHEAISGVASKFRNATDVYILGRGLHYPIALEGALKLKELSYLHAEGMAAGELKHGPLALVEENTQVIALNPSDSTYGDTIPNVNEIKARGATVIGVSDRPNPAYDRWIEIPRMEEALYPLIEAIPLQLLAYYTAITRNADPDYPRNLAKSVTVR